MPEAAQSTLIRICRYRLCATCPWQMASGIGYMVVADGYPVMLCTQSPVLRFRIRRTARYGGCEPTSSAMRLLSVKPIAVASTLATVLVLAGCAGANPAAEPSASTSSSPAVSPSSAAAAATTSGLALTGFGATLAQWNAAHKLDVSVPARNAYLPHVAGDTDGSDTWQVVMVSGDRVNSYTLNLAPTSLRAAEARARQELPPDARVLWRHTFGGTCAQEQFRSATLAAALGDGQVNVEFDNAISSTVTPVTEELFSTYDATTVAQAPHC